MAGRDQVGMQFPCRCDLYVMQSFSQLLCCCSIYRSIAAKPLSRDDNGIMDQLVGRLEKAIATGTRKGKKRKA